MTHICVIVSLCVSVSAVIPQSCWYLPVTVEAHVRACSGGPSVGVPNPPLLFLGGAVGLQTWWLGQMQVRGGAEPVTCPVVWKNFPKAAYSLVCGIHPPLCTPRLPP
jgi:hypothetical protein